MADDAEVVGDEQVGEPELVLEVLEQVDDLRLDRDVERRDRLVGDDQLRVQGQRPGDPDPLALTARELVREAVVVLGVEADPLEQLLDRARGPARGRRSRAGASGRRRSGRLACAGSARRRGPGRPSASRDRSACDALAAEPGDLAALEAHRARGRLDQLQDRAARVDLPQPDSPTRPERLAAADRERDVVDRPHRADLRSNRIPALIGKCLTRWSTSRIGASPPLRDPRARPPTAPGRRPSGPVGRARILDVPGLASSCRRLLEADLARADEPQGALLLGRQPAAVGVPGLEDPLARAAAARRTGRKRAGSGDGRSSPRAARSATAAGRRSGPGGQSAAGRSGSASRAGPRCRGAGGRRRSAPGSPSRPPGPRTSPSPVGDLGDHPEIVGDHDHRHPELSAAGARSAAGSGPGW